jgi:hypothetical protein
MEDFTTRSQLQTHTHDFRSCSLCEHRREIRSASTGGIHFEWGWSEMTQEESVQISNEDLQDFAQRLHTWGNLLPSKDRALLQLLMARAGSSSGEPEVQGYSVESIEAATMSALGPMVKSGLVARTPRAWVQMGTPWVQSVKQ